MGRVSSCFVCAHSVMSVFIQDLVTFVYTQRKERDLLYEKRKHARFTIESEVVVFKEGLAHAACLVLERECIHVRFDGRPSGKGSV